MKACAKAKTQISCAVIAELITRCLCFRKSESTIPLLRNFKISCVYPSSMIVQLMICVGPGRNQEYQFSHVAAQFCMSVAQMMSI